MLRFVMVGCLNTGVDFLTFSMLHAWFGFDKDICQVAGYAMGIVNSFAWNKLWTFREQESNTRTPVQFIEFVGANLISLGVSLLGLNLLNGYAGINVYVSKAIVTALIQLLNYAVYKQVIFQKAPVNARQY
jgi:putative flippase GtrA